LLFSCCGSVAAHFKHDAKRQPVVPQAQASCLNLRRQHREATAAGIGLGTAAKYMQQTASGAAGSGLYTTIKYLRGAAGIGLGTTPRFLCRRRKLTVKICVDNTAKLRPQAPGNGLY
jgi:hypothetical protein